MATHTSTRGFTGLLRAMARTAWTTPPLLTLRRHRFERYFASAVGANLFRGVFHSFAEATRSAPATKPIGYDHPDAAAMYRDRVVRVYPGDYPVLFWLSRFGAEVTSVLDFGGHVGPSFYAYRKYLAFPPHWRWTVCDVAAVVRAGEALARERGERQLSFTTDLKDGSGADVFLANGSLQYLEPPLEQLLAAMTVPPRRLIVNLLPLCEGEGFVTLQNISASFCPYKIQNRQAFINGVRSAGYELVDEWQNAEKSCRIHFNEDRSLHFYTGMLFERRV